MFSDRGFESTFPDILGNHSRWTTLAAKARLGQGAVRFAARIGRNFFAARRCRRRPPRLVAGVAAAALGYLVSPPPPHAVCRTQKPDLGCPESFNIHSNCLGLKQ